MIVTVRFDAVGTKRLALGVRSPVAGDRGSQGTLTAGPRPDATGRVRLVSQVRTRSRGEYPRMPVFTWGASHRGHPCGAQAPFRPATHS